MNDRVSVIIPCYKATATLRRAVESALPDAPAGVEILLVDDGGPDDTPRLCDELAASHSCVRALHRPNGGASAARNTGLDAAQGEWVLFLDADDELLPGLWAALADCPADESDLLLFGLSRASGGTESPDKLGLHGPYTRLQELGDALSPLLFTTGLLAAPYPKLFRRRAIGALRFDEKLQINEDVLFNLEFLQKTTAIYCLHGVYYRQNDLQQGSLSRSMRGDLLDAEAVTRPALQKLLQQNGIDPTPYLHTSRVRAAMNQYDLLTGCRGALDFAARRKVFSRILADGDARAALASRLRRDPNHLLALPYRFGVACRLPGWLAFYTLVKQHFI